MRGGCRNKPGPYKIADVVQMPKEVIAPNEKYQSENASKLSGITAGISDISKRVPKLEAQLSEFVRFKDEFANVSKTAPHGNRKRAH